MDKKKWERLKDPDTDTCMICKKDEKHCTCSLRHYHFSSNGHEPDSYEPNEWQDIISAKENNRLDN